jgi:hypothetical protein
MSFSFTVVVGIPQLYCKLMDFSTPATLGSNLSYILKRRLPHAQNFV